MLTLISYACLLGRFSHVWLCKSMDCGLPGSSVHSFPGQNKGAGHHSLFQGLFPTQGLNRRLLCLLHWQVAFIQAHVKSILQVIKQNGCFCIQQMPWYWKSSLQFNCLVASLLHQRRVYNANSLPGFWALNMGSCSLENRTYEVIGFFG